VVGCDLSSREDRQEFWGFTNLGVSRDMIATGRGMAKAWKTLKAGRVNTAERGRELFSIRIETEGERPPNSKNLRDCTKEGRQRDIP